MRNMLLYVFFLLSGAAGLIYELVWVRELVFVFGGTTFAITTVLVAFMGGLGLGSYGAGRLATRLTRPGRVYGLLEIAIGVYALAVPLLLSLAEPLYRVLYPVGANAPWLLNLFRFLISALILLVPTTCMGATLPVLVRQITLQGIGLGHSVGRLYGLNTLGAVLGVLLAGFVLLPGVGLITATRVAAALNLVVGVSALVLFARPVPALQGDPARRPAKKRPETAAAGEIPVSAGLRRLLLVAFAVSGFAAMVYQLAWTRALVLSVGSSTYSFTCILAAFILGLAVGSLLVARWVDRWRNPALVFGVLEILIGLMAVMIMPLHGQLPYWVESLIRSYRENFGVLLRSQFMLIIAITCVPTLLMGAIFPLATRALARAGEEPAKVTGRAYAINTVGTIAGSFLAGFVLIRSAVLGVQNTIVLASVLNGLAGMLLIVGAGVGPTSGWGVAVRRRGVPALPLVIAIPLVAWLAGRWDQRLLTAAPFLQRGAVADFIERHRVLYFEDGVDVTAAVLQDREDPDGLVLTVNGKPDASTNETDTATMLLIGHLPALIGPADGDVCVIGLGSGLTMSALSRYPDFKRFDCVEISDVVIEAAEYFAPFTYNVLSAEPRLRMIRGDGRNHLLLSDATYQVIVSQPSNPWLAGVANLFTREFFELAQARLTPDGRLAVWLQGYALAEGDFRMIVRTLLEVFEHVSLWNVSADDYMLIGSLQPLRIDARAFAERMRPDGLRADLYRVGVHDPAQLLGRFVATEAPLRAWTADAPSHTDDNALLEFSAPRYLYAGQGGAIAEALTVQQQPISGTIVEPATASDELAAGVANVRAARAEHTACRAALARGDRVAAVQHLVEGYRRDPSSIELYRRIISVRVAIRRALERNPGDAALQSLAAQLAGLDPPPVVPARGLSLERIAELLRSTADQAARSGKWTRAADYMRQAWRLEPAHRQTALNLSEILMRGGQTNEAGDVLDEYLAEHAGDGEVCYRRGVLFVQAGQARSAIPLLECALRSGQFTAPVLAADPLLEPLKADPEFRQLLDRHAAGPD